MKEFESTIREAVDTYKNSHYALSETREATIEAILTAHQLDVERAVREADNSGLMIELAKSRSALLHELTHTSTVFTGYDKIVAETNKQLDKLDALILAQLTPNPKGEKNEI